MQISARNSLKGNIKSIETGAVNSQVIIELSNGVEVVPDYHEKFGGALKFNRRQRSLRRRQSERCDGCNRLISIRKKEQFSITGEELTRRLPYLAVLY